MPIFSRLVFEPLDRTPADRGPHHGSFSLLCTSIAFLTLGPHLFLTDSGLFSLLCAPMSSCYIRAQQFLILYQDTFRSSTYASHRSLPSNLNNFSQSIWCGLKSSRAEISRVILYFESCA